MKQIEITKKAKGVSNWFSEEWVTNGHFAVRRDLIQNCDEHLLSLGFEYRDSEELDGRLRLIPENYNSVPIFDSGFRFQGKTLFFGKNNELVAFETQYIEALGVVRAEYSEITEAAKVYDNGAVSMILKPFSLQGTEVEKQFANFRLLPKPIK